MKVTYDKDTDAAYIYFVNKIEPGSAVDTRLLDEHFDFKDMVNIDLDKNGILLGIEVLSASKQLSPELLKSAEILK